jgi:serine/threonine protein kinase
MSLPGPLPNHGESPVDRFELAWGKGTAPAIDDYLPPPGHSLRVDILKELVITDLDYRWRPAPSVVAGNGQRHPLLEEYLRRYPELGNADQVPPELIAEEYRVRRWWREPVSHSEYAARFPRQASQLQAVLRRIDVELQTEHYSEGRSPEAVVPRQVAGPSPEKAGTVTVASLVNDLRGLDILGQDQLAEIATDQARRFSSPRALVRELLQRNWLTAFQANQLMHGRAVELLIGPYVLLERLGEGGAGLVFKARHRRMNRVVALKLLRKELLADAEVLGRFYREIQIVSQLDYPNVVHAYDAGPAGSTHFLAMEYVEGIDLGRLVKQGGPLPVEQACEYIRQAALGLQHAHERGLVHRDIKPHNLIMDRRTGPIKLADLGLARLSRPANEEATAVLTGGVKGSGTLTPENAVLMGTLDYLAPEQALDFHSADIRADIYSLGCTFYYLLTGQPPFAGGTLAEKLLKHQQAEPPRVEQFRNDVPAAVSTVLRKMLAKRPEERYQAPAEVAAALEAPGRRRKPRPVGLARRWRLPAALVAVLLLCGAVFLMWQSLWPNCTGPLDKLDRNRIPPAQREGLPAEVVAILGAGGEKTAVTAVAISPDSNRVAWAESVSWKIHLWDVETRQEVKGFPRPGPQPPGQPPMVFEMAFSPQGKTLAVGGIGKAELWEIDGDTSRKLMHGPSEEVRGLAFTPDGKRLATGAAKAVMIWDLGTDPPKATVLPLRPVYSLAISPDGQTLAVACWDQPVQLWSLGQAPTLVGSLDKAGSPVRFAPGGQRLATRGQGTDIWLWELSARPHQHNALTIGPGTPPPHLAFSAAGNKLVGALDRRLVVWDLSPPVPTKRHEWSLGSPISAVAFAADGRHLVTGSMDGRVHIFRLPASAER